VKPVIKQLRPSPNVRLLTTEDLIVFSPEIVEFPERTTFPAVRVEDKGNGAEVSIGKETFKGWRLPFQDVALDRHGTIEAARRVLGRCFWWERVTEIDGSPVWRLRVRRYGDVGFQLFLIAHWVGWNAAGIKWDERNYLAQNCEMFLGKMDRDAFMRRFHS
jgi:hypothetical protein